MMRVFLHPELQPLSNPMHSKPLELGNNVGGDRASFRHIANLDRDTCGRFSHHQASTADRLRERLVLA